MKTVLFDVDGVLVDSFEANLKYFQDLFKHTGYKALSREEYKELFHKPMRDVIRIITKGSEETVEKIYQVGMGPDISYDISRISIPDGVEESLEQLNKEYNLGVVTSRIRESVFEGPRNNLAHIKKYFTVAIAFEDTENHKPHPDPLLLAAKKFAVDPAECVYIGDTESDMTAAKAAGMKCIHYSSTPLENADGNTYDFRKLPDIIESLFKTKV